MTATELYQRILAYGADEAGIRDRFGDDAVLYQACFMDLIEEQNFALLEAAMAAHDLPRAFDAAHALKGLAGNLGVTAFYDAIRPLVEALRENRAEDADAAYGEVLRQRDLLVCVLSDTPSLMTDAPAPKTAMPAPETALPAPAAKDEKDPLARIRKNFLYRSIAILLVAMAAIGFLFSRIRARYHENVLRESGQHLIETSNQTKLYIEEQLRNDWKIALSIADSIRWNGYNNDADVLRLLKRKLSIWDISDLMIYTESGYCIDADGETASNDVASQAVVNARKFGQYLSVVESSITFTIPVETQQQYRGARIVAVSVVQDLSTFLNDMHFSSFNEQAWVYLTDENGIVISRLSNENATPTFNFRSLAREMEITPLTASDTPESLFTSPDSAAFLLSDESARNYAVSSPIDTGAAPFRLFYLAPEAVVNNAMNSFSSQLTTFSMVMILLFAALALVVFLYFYQIRKKTFDSALVARDKMLDLLVTNTRTSFALFTVNAQKPDYVSSNTVDVTGDAYWTLSRDESGYRFRNDAQTEPETLRNANAMLADWDGKSVFRSEYIENNASVPPSYFVFHLYPIDGEREQYVGIAMDVTAAYAREEMTKNALSLAKRANEAKSRFLSNMSHDIRTPMNAIINMTAFAQECLDQPKQLAPYLHTIRESADHLMLLINDVLDMNRIESGQAIVANEPLDLTETLMRQIDIIRPLCSNKNQTLLLDFNRLSNAPICGDTLKISQIVMNLLSNAVKFTPEKGAVRFTAETLPSLSHDIMEVRFIVEDNGIGMNKDALHHIFDPFYRVDDKRVGKIEGTGLGLSICKSYVEAMGGAIHCESEEGEGSTFTVELVFQKAASAPVSRASLQPHDATVFLGLHCLVVEDNPTNQAIAKMLLTRFGFLVDFADNGLAGVEAFLHAAPHTFDIIYMDIRMPVMDGYEATLAIRRSQHPEANTIPIVAMTANVYTEDIEQARIVGMDGYLGKPLVSFEVIEQTKQAFRKREGNIE